MAVVDTDQLRCPLTLCLYLDPVVASDGYIYERHAIELYVNAASDGRLISLVSQHIMTCKQSYDCILIKGLVNNLMKTDPNLIAQQYSIPPKNIWELETDTFDSEQLDKWDINSFKTPNGKSTLLIL